MKKKLIEWLIAKLLPGYHLHRDPLRKTDLNKVMGSMPDMEVEHEHQAPEQN